MSISLSPSDVRDAGDFDATEHPDSEIQFETTAAERLINAELSPPDTDNERYVETAAYFAAALVADGKSITQANLGDAAIQFDSDESLSLLETAFALDPTGDTLKRTVMPDAQTVDFVVADGINTD